MFKYWIKNRAWITFFWTLLLCLTIGVVFVLPNIDKWSDNYSKESIYSNTKIDYDIPAPTKEQLNEIENMSFVDNVFGYYYTEATVVVNKSRNVNVNQKEYYGYNWFLIREDAMRGWYFTNRQLSDTNTTNGAMILSREPKKRGGYKSSKGRHQNNS